MYERGPDRPKLGPAWPSAAIDRVRLEYTAKRRVLVKHGLSTLEDLVENPRFFAINSNRWRFKQFQAKKLPWVSEGYREGSFQAEFLAAKSTRVVSNLAKHVRDINELSAFEYRIVESMSRFDAAWTHKLKAQST